MRLFYFIEFLAFYIKEVILSNLKVAHDVLTPTHLMRPGFIEVSIDELTDRQIFVLANLITMTPGTLSLNIDDSESRLLIHNMYSIDPIQDGKDLEENYVRRIKNVF